MYRDAEGQNFRWSSRSIPVNQFDTRFGRYWPSLHRTTNQRLRSCRHNLRPSAMFSLLSSKLTVNRLRLSLRHSFSVYPSVRTIVTLTNLSIFFFLLRESASGILSQLFSYVSKWDDCTRTRFSWHSIPENTSSLQAKPPARNSILWRTRGQDALEWEYQDLFFSELSLTFSAKDTSNADARRHHYPNWY